MFNANTRLKIYQGIQQENTFRTSVFVLFLVSLNKKHKKSYNLFQYKCLVNDLTIKKKK